VLDAQPGGVAKSNVKHTTQAAAWRRTRPQFGA